MYNSKASEKLRARVFMVVIKPWNHIKMQVIKESSAVSFKQESALLILMVYSKKTNNNGLTEGIFTVCCRKLLQVGECVGDESRYLLLSQLISHWLMFYLNNGKWSVPLLIGSWR